MGIRFAPVPGRPAFIIPVHEVWHPFATWGGFHWMSKVGVRFVGAQCRQQGGLVLNVLAIPTGHALAVSGKN